LLRVINHLICKVSNDPAENRMNVRSRHRKGWGSRYAKDGRERGAHRVVNVAEAVELVKRWGRVPLNPLCGGCPPDLAWIYLRRVVQDVIPALTGMSHPNVRLGVKE
jgi:hypothetical protein